MIKEKVMKYYELVDNEDFEELLELFSKNTVYLRCGKEIEGLENLEKFYLEERKIKGTHTIEEIHIFENEIIIKGVFNKVNDGGGVIRFVDIFYFNEEELISRRETYLASGYKLVE